MYAKNHRLSLTNHKLTGEFNLNAIKRRYENEFSCCLFLVKEDEDEKTRYEENSEHLVTYHTTMGSLEKGNDGRGS